jgi:nucleotide-binding universal stress UspA family protein
MIIAHASQVLTLDDPAFVLAVALAARSGAAVRGIHIAGGVAPEPSPPAPDALLERWGRHAGELDHTWLLAPRVEDTADALLDAIATLEPQLLIVNTHARSGLARFFVGSVAEGVARNVTFPVLLLPSYGPTLVDAQHGAVTLERALLLAGRLEETERAAEGLSTLVKLAGGGRCRVELLHIEDGTCAPHAVLSPGLDVALHCSPGPLERAVAERAREYEPNVVVMTSRGHDQLSDVIFSSHTERVLHEIRRPLLWVPA